MVKRFNSIFVSSFIIKLFKLDGRFTSLLPFSVFFGGWGVGGLEGGDLNP